MSGKKASHIMGAALGAFMNVAGASAEPVDLTRLPTQLSFGAQQTIVPEGKTKGGTIGGRNLVEDESSLKNILEDKATPLQRCFAFSVLDHAIAGGFFTALDDYLKVKEADGSGIDRRVFSFKSSEKWNRYLALEIVQDKMTDTFTTQVLVQNGERFALGIFNAASDEPWQFRTIPGQEPVPQDLERAREIVKTARERCKPTT